MDLGIKGRRAIINGGSSGMGKGTALALAREGVEVFVVARGEERLLRACEDIRGRASGTVHPVVADFSTVAGRERILSLCPSPDILVTTSTPPEMTADYTDVTAADWNTSLEVTLVGVVEFIRAVVPGMVERRWGRVVNIATGAAKFPHELRILSGPPRAALVNYCVAVSRRVAKYNVTINNVLPGMHFTDPINARLAREAAANGNTIEQEIQGYIDRFRIPAGTFGDPEDTGALTAMLCSEQARYTSGQSLCVDGGLAPTTF
ncbi:MAG: SDR family oxidoreductase [Gammaproteobacteria bacterium]